MMRLLALLFATTLMSCSPETDGGACGESFCLPSDARLLSKRTPVHDFNLYDVEWNGVRFVIYEGNAPDEGEGAESILSLPLDPEAKLRRDNERGSVVARMRPDWPNYLQINGPCAAGDQCEAAALAKGIIRR
ncbi:hypothetical protein [Altererythrobacter sp. Root672]|uniref:hypothetical protein n=1 Tax=Altererythrobacter sp. Root672 TaxID=1736584 RepID=UPI000A83D903|nr:hypothetical protein [Altererythrobacter sp. Root672]